MDERHRIAHLLRRAGFGATPEEIDGFFRKGLAATVEELVDFEKVPEDLDELGEELTGDLLDLNDGNDLKAWWICRMIRTRRPLQEKMALFWHGHFATSNNKVFNGPLMQRQNELFRRYALGPFGDLLLQVSRDPAMLLYLDGNQNRKGRPNENYGREVMELFTLGIGHYSEKDVKEAARAFTGWHVRENEFFFNAKQHDEGEKDFLGRRGNFDGEDIVRILASHPQAARFLSRKLVRFFLCEEPPEDVVETLTAEYLRTGGQIREMLRKLFRSERFYGEEFVGRKVKSPVELVVGAVRALYGKAPLRLLARFVGRLGQDLFYPPNVKGWEGGTAWLNTSTAVERLNLMKALVAGVGNFPSPLLNPKEVVDRYGIRTGEEIVRHFLGRFSMLEVSPSVFEKLVEYAKERSDPAMEKFPGKINIEAKVPGVAHLVLCLPEFQLA